MRASSIRVLAVFGLAAGLGGCNTAAGILAANEPAHISRVQVSLAPNLTTSARFSQMLQAKATQDATRFGRAGAAKELRIAVHRHSYKNPVTSLLIGDANYAGAKVSVVDVATGKVQGEAEASAIDNIAINGMVGAVMAAAQDQQRVDERLAELLARDALTQAYGSSVAGVAYQRPVAAAEPATTDAPAPVAPAAKPKAPKPAKPGQVPVARAKSDKTAMAAPVAVVR